MNDEDVTVTSYGWVRWGLRCGVPKIVGRHVRVRSLGEDMQVPEPPFDILECPVSGNFYFRHLVFDVPEGVERRRAGTRHLLVRVDAATIARACVGRFDPYALLLTNDEVGFMIDTIAPEHGGAYAYLVDFTTLPSTYLPFSGP